MLIVAPAVIYNYFLYLLLFIYSTEVDFAVNKFICVNINYVRRLFGKAYQFKVI